MPRAHTGRALVQISHQETIFAFSYTTTTGTGVFSSGMDKVKVNVNEVSSVQQFTVTCLSWVWVVQYAEYVM